MEREPQEGKPRFSLVFPKDIPYKEQMLTRQAELMARGAIKYSDRNWEKADSEEELERTKVSAWRHFMQWYFGECDEDHAASLQFNITAAERLKYIIKGK